MQTAIHSEQAQSVVATPETSHTQPTAAFPAIESFPLHDRVAKPPIQLKGGWGNGVLQLSKPATRQEEKRPARLVLKELPAFHNLKGVVPADVIKALTTLASFRTTKSSIKGSNMAYMGLDDGTVLSAENLKKGSAHSEEVLQMILANRAKDGKSVKVEWWFTERSPCGNCQGILSAIKRKTGGNVRVFYIADYEALSSDQCAQAILDYYQSIG